MTWLNHTQSASLEVHLEMLYGHRIDPTWVHRTGVWGMYACTAIHIVLIPYLFIHVYLAETHPSSIGWPWWLLNRLPYSARQRAHWQGCSYRPLLSVSNGYRNRVITALVRIYCGYHSDIRRMYSKIPCGYFRVHSGVGLAAQILCAKPFRHLVREALPTPGQSTGLKFQLTPYCI